VTAEDGRLNPPRKRVKNSNANENKQLISPSIAENAVCAANFAPFLHFFESHFQFQLLPQLLGSSV
jgi:hypothetical protein